MAFLKNTLPETNEDGACFKRLKADGNIESKMILEILSGRHKDALDALCSVGTPNTFAHNMFTTIECIADFYGVSTVWLRTVFTKNGFVSTQLPEDVKRISHLDIPRRVKQNPGDPPHMGVIVASHPSYKGDLPGVELHTTCPFNTYSPRIFLAAAFLLPSSPVGVRTVKSLADSDYRRLASGEKKGFGFILELISVSSPEEPTVAANPAPVEETTVLTIENLVNALVEREVKKRLQTLLSSVIA
jgi:hypothetical protein